MLLRPRQHDAGPDQASPYRRPDPQHADRRTADHEGKADAVGAGRVQVAAAEQTIRERLAFDDLFGSARVACQSLPISALAQDYPDVVGAGQPRQVFVDGAANGLVVERPCQRMSERDQALEVLDAIFSDRVRRLCGDRVCLTLELLSQLMKMNTPVSTMSAGTSVRPRSCSISRAMSNRREIEGEKTMMTATARPVSRTPSCVGRAA